MFVIDVMSRVPVYEQIINQVEEQIMTGILKEGDKNAICKKSVS